MIDYKYNEGEILHQLQKYIDDLIEGEQNTIFGKKLKLKMV